MKSTHRRVAALILFVILWWGVTSTLVTDQLRLPSPLQVLDTAGALWSNGELQRHVLATLPRIIKGFMLGSIVGIAVGLVLGQSRLLGRIFIPPIELLRPVPALAWIPLVLIWFGIGETGKILLIAYAVFFDVSASTLDGVRYLKPQLIQAARSLGATRRQMFFKVSLPASLPYTMTGLSIGMGNAFSVLVTAELLGAIAGLGWMISDARRFFRTDVVLLGMVVIGLVGFIFTTVISWTKTIVVPWHGGTGSSQRDQT